MGKVNKAFELEQEQQELMNVLYDRLDVVSRALVERVMHIQDHLNTLANGKEINENVKSGQPIPQFIFTEHLKEGVIMNPDDDIFVVGTKKGQSAATDHPSVTLKALHQFA